MIGLIGSEKCLGACVDTSTDLIPCLHGFRVIHRCFLAFTTKPRLPESDNKRYGRRSNAHTQSVRVICDDLDQLIFFYSIPAPWSEGHSFGDPNNVARERPKRRLPESDKKMYERRSNDNKHSFCGWCDDLNQLIFFLPSIPALLSEGQSLGDPSNVARERPKRRLPESDKKMYERRSNDNNHSFCGWCDGLNQLVFFSSAIPAHL